MVYKFTLLFVSTILFGIGVSPAGAKEPHQVLNGTKIYNSVSKSKYVFYNFKFNLTPENTITIDSLIGSGKFFNPASKNRIQNLLEFPASNLAAHGQFHILIPAQKFPMTKKTSGFVIARMPQTLEGDDGKWLTEKTAKTNKGVIEKQKLYARIRGMVRNKTGKVEVVFQTPPDSSIRKPRLIDTNVLFRTAFGQYITYVG
jgi:hypothetical protein